MALTLSSSLSQQIAAVHSADRLVWLIELVRTASVTNYYALSTEDIVYNGRTYTKIAGEIADISQEEGTMTELRLALSNVSRSIQGFIEAGEVLNRKTTLRLVSTQFLQNTTHELTIALYVSDAMATEQAVALTLSFWDLAGQPFPKNRFSRDRCQFVFKDAATCQYSGAVTTCDKSYASSSGCLGRDNQANYGAFIHILTGPATTTIP
mgnify:CR=1 FL=1